MALVVGSLVGAHEIVGLLGAGGMGEVYRARDTKLNRQVAIKILPAQYALDPDRIARFEREAQAVAALNHPGIAAIHEFNQVDGLRFLVLELVEGDTLAEAIETHGAFDVERALTITRDIAAALEAAHEKGICHRDLKPANVKLTPDGTVKVLDFGLAKILETSPAAPAMTHSPTLSLAGTYPGVILGTAGYMSPEQAKGFAADHRSDIFSLGCILYELLTGRRAFEGDSASEVLASVLKSEPDLTKLPAHLNTRIVDLLRRCLEKNPKKRWHAAADVRLELDTTLERHAFTGDVRPVSATSWPRRGVLLAIGIIAGAIVGGLAVWNLLRSTPASAVVRFDILPPQGHSFALTPAFLSLSPDGRSIAFATGRDTAEFRLWIRRMDSRAAEPIPGTEGGMFPVWSPDGRHLAFTTRSSGPWGRLRVVDTRGGTPVTLSEYGTPGAWSHGMILFRGAGERLYRVADTGGEPVPATDLDSKSEIRHVPGFFLPDGRRFVFESHGSDSVTATVFLASLDGRERQRLMHGRLSNVSLANGHLIYVRDGVLMAQTFDETEGRITGAPVPLAENVDQAAAIGHAAFAVSSNGVLAYRSAATQGTAQLTWFSRDGKSLATLPFEGAFQASRRPALSPDGRRLAVTRIDGPAKSDVWILDLERNVPTRVTFNESSRVPIWSPDGSRIVFASAQRGTRGLFLRDARGAGPDQVLYESSSQMEPQAISPDGKTLLFGQSPQGVPEIWALPLTGERKPIPIVKTGFPASNAVFSPDGRWFAYCEGDSGADQVYVQPYPPSGQRVRVSPANGSAPEWTADGKTVLYATAEYRLMVVNVSPQGGTLQAGIPRELFTAPSMFVHRSFVYDSAKSRLLLPIPQEQVRPSPLTVILNWPADLKSRAPGGS
jgi:serine/threonine protein kinase/Tol biopolymer transport system component